LTEKEAQALRPRSGRRSHQQETGFSFVASGKMLNTSQFINWFFHRKWPQTRKDKFVNKDKTRSLSPSIISLALLFLPSFFSNRSERLTSTIQGF